MSIDTSKQSFDSISVFNTDISVLLNQFGDVQLVSFFAKKLIELKEPVAFKVYSDFFDYCIFLKKNFISLFEFYSNKATEIGLPVHLYLINKVRLKLADSSYQLFDTDFKDLTSNVEIIKIINRLVDTCIINDYLNFVHNKA